jgi:hypothetical protein
MWTRGKTNADDDEDAEDAENPRRCVALKGARGDDEKAKSVRQLTKKKRDGQRSEERGTI